MATDNLGLMNAAIQKMHWHEARQKELAKNIANADTPDYRPQDIAPLDFKQMLESSSSKLSLGASGATQLKTTNEKHLSLGGALSSPKQGVAKNQKNPYETSPSGNAVILEEQLLKMNQNFTDHRLTTTIYQKNLEMIKASSR